MKPRQRFNLILSFGNAAGRMVAKKCFQLQPMLIQFALRMVETYGRKRFKPAFHIRLEIAHQRRFGDPSNAADSLVRKALAFQIQRIEF